MINLKTKYKTRKPKETIKLVNNFFKDQGFEIVVANNKKSEAGTYYCHLLLMKNGYTFQFSNGKGMTEEYSLASGYAELYERYCNRSPWDLNILYNKCYTTKKIKEQQYIYNKEEKKLDLEKDILSNSYFYNFFTNYTKDKEIMKKIIRCLTNDNLIGLPYQSLENDNEIVYLDPKIMAKTVGSQGMAAGNSIEEALIQANSELYEKYVDIYFFLKNFEQYYLIDLNSIADKTLKEKIDNILKLGYKFYIADLSYNFNVPVLMSILIEPKKGQIFVNLGSFPVFEIALERVITELYQGIPSFKKNESIVRPYKNQYKEIILSNFLSIQVKNYFPEDFFVKAVYRQPNMEVFINKNNNLKVLLEHCKKINKKLNYQVYWTDKSLNKDMVAIQLYCPELHLSCFSDYHLKNTFVNPNWDNIFKIIDLYKSIFNDILKDEYDYTKFVLMLKYMTEQENDFYQAHTLICHDPFNIGFNSQFLSNLKVLLDLDSINLDSSFKYFEYFYNYEECRKYILLNNYISTQNYNKKELKNIFNEVFSFNVTDEDIDNSLKGEYLVKKIFYEPIRNFIKQVYLC